MLEKSGKPATWNSLERIQMCQTFGNSCSFPGMRITDTVFSHGWPKLEQPFRCPFSVIEGIFSLVFSKWFYSSLTPYHQIAPTETQSFLPLSPPLCTSPFAHPPFPQSSGFMMKKLIKIISNVKPLCWEIHHGGWG